VKQLCGGRDAPSRRKLRRNSGLGGRALADAGPVKRGRSSQFVRDGAKTLAINEPKAAWVERNRSCVSLRAEWGERSCRRDERRTNRRRGCLMLAECPRVGRPRLSSRLWPATQAYFSVGSERLSSFEIRTGTKAGGVSCQLRVCLRIERVARRKIRSLFRNNVNERALIGVNREVRDLALL
jgi:hypothetical protein